MHVLSLNVLIRKSGFEMPKKKKKKKEDDFKNIHVEKLLYLAVRLYQSRNKKEGNKTKLIFMTINSRFAITISCRIFSPRREIFICFCFQG